MKPRPYQEVARKLRAAGFSEVTQRGSHVKFIREGTDGRRRTAIVPRDREVAAGTLRSILKQAGISLADFDVL